MKRQIAAALTLGVILLAGAAHSKTFHAGDMTSNQWSQLMASGPQEVVVEFRQGDEIPISFASEGDLLETSQTGISYVKVKRSFWVRIHQNDIEMSLDGSTFKPFKEVISGSFTAGAGANQPGIPVNSINLVLKTLLK
jgi:hypothetical protein